MRLFLKLFSESVLFSIHALVVNKLRTFLSLLGITIGVFAIIVVFTIVDSMERNIQDSIASLGENVVFIQKWPWDFSSDFPWWNYIKRPDPTLPELAELQRRCDAASASAFMISARKMVEYENSAMENIDIVSVSHDYSKVRDFELAAGRYFTENESGSGMNVALIGAAVAYYLFGPVYPIGEEIKIGKLKFTVVGVFKVEGESIIGNSADYQVIIPVNYARKIINIRNPRLDPFIMVKAAEGISNQELKDELSGAMRSIRKLKPEAKDDFSLNETSMLSEGVRDMFGAVNIAGAIIGLFAIIVGGFGIANIMFVSVKERTTQIGIQKSLGAKNSFILFQFLSESVILCVIGGLIGLLLVYIVTLVASRSFEFTIYLSVANIVRGILISVFIGIVSGIIPAWKASRLEPAEAIRANQ